jgi:large conductance mechanosensitive channel
MGLISEFKAFAMKGNVVDMAVGVIIGAAFGKIVSSVVNDVLMPPIGKVMGGVNFSGLYMSLEPSKSEGMTLEAAKAAGVPLISYGAFIQTVIDFVIIAFVLFMVIKAMNAAKRKEEAKPAAPAEIPPQEKLLKEIRDLLAAKR